MTYNEGQANSQDERKDPQHTDVRKALEGTSPSCCRGKTPDVRSEPDHSGRLAGGTSEEISGTQGRWRAPRSLALLALEVPVRLRQILPFGTQNGVAKNG